MKRKLMTGVLLLLIMAGSATCAKSTEDDYELVFSEEFNQPNGSRPNPELWSPCRRGTGSWSRWISNVPEVAFIRHGKLVCRAIPNTVNPSDTAAMLTGAVETKGKYAFQYGKIEVRAKTHRHTGNFPAIWLMPEPPSPAHPDGGEIDIFETIDNEQMAYHTAHSHWTVVLKQKRSPQNNFRERVTVDKWHVYGLLWDEEKLVWTVDGKQVGTYRKSTSAEALENGQWPFDRPFHIILNQSVGREGGWAAPADRNHTYETQFDWVRVYRKKN